MESMERPLGLRAIRGSSLIRRADNLSTLRRGREVLFIEKETAGWIVLSGARLSLFNSLNRSMTFDEIISGPVSSLSEREKEKLILQLYHRNMLSINGQSYLNPEILWAVPQKHPQFLCFHITSACNLACRYCYAGATPRLKKLPLPVAERGIERILEELPPERLTIDFHGGEPLMAFDELIHVVRYAIDYNKKRGMKKQLTFLVQSNGTLITPEKAKLMESLGIKPGFSLDGPEHVQDSQRVFPDGTGSFQRVWKNMEDLRKAGFDPGFLAVIHNPEHYAETFNFFISLGLRAFRINYSAYIGRATEELEFPHGRGETFAEKYLGMVDLAIEFTERTGESLSIKDLDNQINNIVTRQRPFMCYRSPCGCGNSILGFGADGGIYACEEGTGVDDFRIGSIYDDKRTIPEIIETSEVMKEIGGRTVETIPRCRECTFKRFCGGRCTTKSYARFGNFRREDPMCRFYQMVYPALIWKIHDNPGLVGKLLNQGGIPVPWQNLENICDVYAPCGGA